VEQLGDEVMGGNSQGCAPSATVVCW